MTNRAATSRLYVALASLLTAALTLLSSAVRLVASSLTWLAVRVEAASARAPRAATTPATRPAAASVIVPAPTAHSSGAQAQAARLTFALSGLGFRAPEVRKFVSGLDAGRLEHAPLDELIKLAFRSIPTTAERAS
jgi:RuvA, C-terminal domain